MCYHEDYTVRLNSPERHAILSALELAESHTTVAMWQCRPDEAAHLHKRLELHRSARRQIENAKQHRQEVTS